MKKAGCYSSILVFVLLFLSKNGFAQDSKYSLHAGYFYSPTNPSYKRIYRSDHGSEPFKDATIRGFGIGYSIRAFKFFSPELSFMYYTTSGIDNHIEDKVKFDGVQLRLGGVFHIIDKNPGINVNFGYIKVQSRFEQKQEGAIKIERNGEGGGMYFGPSVIVKINKNHAFRFSMYGVIVGSSYEDYTSFDLAWMATIHSELAISYVFKF